MSFFQWDDDRPRPQYEVRQEKIGVCEDCGWWFPVSEAVLDEEDAHCPKPGCKAGVMLLWRAPAEASVRKEVIPASLLGDLLGITKQDGEGEESYRNRVMHCMRQYGQIGGWPGGNNRRDFEAQVEAAMRGTQDSFDAAYRDLFDASA